MSLDLSQIPTPALEAELRKRKETATAQRSLALKAREVRVECPICCGQGKVPVHDWVGQWQGDSVCGHCNGNGNILAYKV